MENRFNKLFERNYKIIKKSDGIDIFHINYDGIIEQETYIKCKQSALGWTILKSMRDNNSEIGTFAEEEYAVCIIYVLCERNFERAKENNNLKRSLRDCYGKNALAQATQIIKGECEPKYFSLDKPKNNAICMENINELYAVFYLSEDGNRVDIVSDATFGRALGVVYSFSILLKKFDEIYEQLMKYYPTCKKYHGKLLRYYLNK